MSTNWMKLGVLPVAIVCQMAASPLIAAPADPQSAPAESSGGLEEIVVTATRRQERLQDVPISVLAFSQEKLDSEGIKSIDDLSRLSPGLNFQRNGMSSAGNYNDEGSDINIRGVDSTAGTSTTGIYIDDSPIQTRHVGFGSVNAFPALFDLERVEVLKGPQGTLFGAGAEGGVVRFITPEPDLTKTSIYTKADVADTDGGAPSYEGGAAVGVPLIDNVLAFRASFSYRRDGGWVDRTEYNLEPNASVLLPTPVYNGVTTDSNANYWNTITARFALKWQVNDALEIMPSFYYQHVQIADTSAYWVSLSDPGANVYRNGNYGTNPSNDPFNLTAIRVKWDLGFASLFSNTSYYDRNQSGLSDYTQYLRATWASFGELPNTFPSRGDNGYATFQDDQRNFYQELRLSSKDTDSWLSWNGGLFYSRLSENVPENIYDTTLNQQIINYTTKTYGTAIPLCTAGDPVFQCPGGLIYYGPTDRIIDKQVAAFGEVTFKFLDTFKATAGLRVSRLTYEGIVASTGPFVGATTNAASSALEKPVTPKLVLAWEPNRDNNIYLSASKGFRPGGLNTPVGAICSPSLTAIGQSQVPGAYSSDNLWSYELGSKNSFFEHTLQINASLFYIDWNNIQQNVYLPSCGEQFTANLGKAKSEGGDIEILYRPIAALTFDLTAAYTDARLTKTSCGGTLTYDATTHACTSPGLAARPISTNGDALLGAPWAFTGSSEYHFAEWGGKMPYFRIDYQHSTAQHSLLQGQDPNNGLFDQTLPGLPVINNLSLRAGMRFSGVDMSIYANNVTNSHPLMFLSRDIAPGAGPPGTGGSQMGPTTDDLYFERGVRPRTIGVTATYRY